MNIIYEPKGPAAEYAHKALNHRIGCSHGCSYCFGPATLRMDKEKFHKPHDRKGVLAALQKEAPKFTGTDERVLLCFIGDPYDIINNESNLTRDVLRILRTNDVPFQILTKGGMRAVPDFDLYSRADAFGTTLTFLEGLKSFEYEPHAATPGDRIRAIEIAHAQNIETFVSLEPVIDPQQSLKIIERTHKFVDHYRIGKLNHQPSKINWRRFAIAAIKLCRDLGKDYYIKNDLAKHLEGFAFTNTDRRKVKRELTKKPINKTLFED